MKQRQMSESELGFKGTTAQGPGGVGGTAVTHSQHLAGLNKTVAWVHMVTQP